MESENIKVDTQLLKNYSKEIDASYKNMNQYLAQCKTAVKNLRATWIGKGSDEFQARFDNIFNKCSEVLNTVHTYSLTLDEAAQVYSTNEAKVTNNANKLKINLK